MVDKMSDAVGGPYRPKTLEDTLRCIEENPALIGLFVFRLRGEDQSFLGGAVARSEVDGLLDHFAVTALDLPVPPGVSHRDFLLAELGNLVAEAAAHPESEEHLCLLAMTSVLFLACTNPHDGEATRADLRRGGWTVWALDEADRVRFLVLPRGLRPEGLEFGATLH